MLNSPKMPRLVTPDFGGGNQCTLEKELTSGQLMAFILAVTKGCNCLKITSM